MRLDPGGIDQIEEPLEGIEIEDAPRLNVHCTGLDLLTQFVDLQFNRVIDGGHGSTLIEMRRAAGQLVAAAVAVRLLHFRQHLQNTDGVGIIDRLAFRAVANDGVVAGEREHRINANDIMREPRHGMYLNLQPKSLLLLMKQKQKILYVPSAYLLITEHALYLQSLSSIHRA